MKRRLFIVRHAKSSWADASLADFQRPLNERGMKAAPFMGEFMQKNGYIPTKILSSPATRARHTAQLLKEGGSFDAEIDFDGRIYDASPEEWSDIVKELPDDHDNVMLVGHNPGMEGFIRHLTGDYERMPTAAVAVIELDLKRWDKIGELCCTLHQVFRPRELMDEQ